MKAALISSVLLASLSRAAIAQDFVVTRAESLTPVDDAQFERIRQVVRSLGPRASTPAQLVQLTRDLPPTSSAKLYLEIGGEFLAAGEWDVGATVLSHLLEQYPDEPATTDALLLLVRLYSSTEVAHSQRQSHDTAQELRLPPGWRAEHATDGDKQPHSGMAPYALYLANGQLQQHPTLAENSPLAFQCAVAARRSGQTQQYKSWLSLLKHKREAAEWRTRALAEDWLAESRKGEPPLPVTRCARAADGPHLDGVLNEPCWQSEIRAQSSGPEDRPKSEIQFAHDAEFLYLAARCYKVAGGDYSPDVRPRSYDADLSGHDQVRLWLDVDRDYSTSFQLTVDHRGWTGDRCWLDAGWNPKWFVAAGGDQEAWTIEAAIPWTELAEQPPRAGGAWAFGAERVSPTGQADTGPADFGLLLFE